MNTPENIISSQSERVQRYFIRWNTYMEERVRFWEIHDGGDFHTKNHCKRVLLYALRIGDMRRVSDQQLTALSHAAIFHDSRRKDNSLDTGHGARAAEYYKSFCQDAQDGSIAFLPDAYASIRCHDISDSLGMAFLATHCQRYDLDGCQEVYRIFKDADGLDRIRISMHSLDPTMLRTDEAKNMIAFAVELVEATIPPEQLSPYYGINRSKNLL